MKTFMIVALLVAAVSAASIPSPQNPDAQATIVTSESDNIGVGGYRFNTQTSNGIIFTEEGVLTDVGTEKESLEVRGRYSYVGLDGNTYEVIYLANKDGFQPSGKHLPA